MNLRDETGQYSPINIILWVIAILFLLYLLSVLF